MYKPANIRTLIPLCTDLQLVRVKVMLLDLADSGMDGVDDVRLVEHFINVVVALPETEQLDMLPEQLLRYIYLAFSRTLEGKPEHKYHQPQEDDS